MTGCALRSSPRERLPVATKDASRLGRNLLGNSFSYLSLRRPICLTDGLSPQLLVVVETIAPPFA